MWDVRCGMWDVGCEMKKPELPEYSGIFLEPDEIRYQEIDPPLRNLIRLINRQSWARTYGCCAGPAHHGRTPGDESKFFIGFFLEEDSAAINQLRLWLDEANRLNGSTGLRAEMDQVYRHPFGQGVVDGWRAYHLAAHEIGKGNTNLTPQIYLRLIKCLHPAWEKIF